MRRCAFVILVLCLLSVGAATARAQQTQPLSAPNPGGSEAERWAWEQMRTGVIADFNGRCVGRSQPPLTEMFPSLDDDDRRSSWSGPCRLIEAAFIKRVLTEEPWRAALPRAGMQIHGTHIAWPLDLSGERIAGEVRLIMSRFEGAVTLDHAWFERSLNLHSSAFRAGIHGHQVRVGGDMELFGAMLRGRPLLEAAPNMLVYSAMLGRASIGGDLSFDGAVFESQAILDRMRISGNPILIGTELPGLDLSGTRIDGELELGGPGRRPLPRWRRGARLLLRDVRTASLRDQLDADGNDAGSVRSRANEQL
jgi:hypothetical protein